MVIAFDIHALGEQAITIEFGNKIDRGVHQSVQALFNSLKKAPLQGMIDAIPAYTTLTIIFDNFYGNEVKSILSFADLRSEISHRLSKSPEQRTHQANQRTIPVCYHHSLAPDLQYVADHHALTTEQVIELHTGTIYTVYMIGFMPGFPYMGILDKRIETPRKQVPRKIVQPGSVGLAGNQTGIYPFATPGGWQLIGQTPLVLFDPNQDEPSYFSPGDEVEFYPISIDEYNRQKTK